MFTSPGNRAGHGVLSRRWVESGPVTRLVKSSGQNVNFNVFWGAVITWDTTPDQDDVGGWNPIVSNTQIFTPPAFSWVRLTAYTIWSNINNGVHLCGIGTNKGTITWNSVAARALNESGEEIDYGWQRCKAGDDFYLLAYQNVANPTQVFAPAGGFYGGPAWFQAEWGN